MKRTEQPIKHLTTRITVAQSPEAVFEAINNVRGWWSGQIEGTTDQLGAVFTYRYEDLHYSQQKITELVPGKRIVWQVEDAQLNFVKDKTEWNGTSITFDILPKGERTELVFTHVGISPACECFEACSEAWTSYIGEHLRKLLTPGPERTKPR